METAMAQKIRATSREAIVEILECWARYRQGRVDGGTGWPKQVLLGKLRDGMPGTNCPKCAGSGKVKIESPGISSMRVDCPICDGAGKVKLDPTGSKVNPALISGNGPRSFYDDDPVSQRVDWLVCTALEEDQRVVLMAEFCRFGNRNQKIARLHITHSMYNGLLDAAMDIIQEELNNS